MGKWVYTLDVNRKIKDCQNGKITLHNCAQQIANELRSKLPQHIFNNDYEIDDIVCMLEDFGIDAGENDFDDIMERLYYWADDKQVWLGLYKQRTVIIIHKYICGYVLKIAS